MDQKQLLHLINEVPFFKDFPNEDLERLVSMKSCVVQLDREQVLIQEGQIDRNLYVILKGKLRFTKTVSKKEVTITKMQKGAIFGAMFMLSRKKHPAVANAVADNETVLIVLTPNFMKTLDIELQTRLREELLELVIRRLSVLIEKHAKLMKEVIF